MPQFEKQWQKRFESFAKGTTDAQIAGWSQTGLQARVFFFNQHVKVAQGLWIDAGTGAGTYANLLAQKGAQVVGFDYSFLSLQKAKQKAKALNFLCADVYHIPLKSHLAQGCLCFGVLQALEQESLLIQELARILKPEGQLWLDGLNQFSLPHLFKSLVRNVRAKPKHLQYTSPWRIKRVLQTYGFSQVTLYWAPILPGRLAKWNPFLLKANMQKVLRGLFFLSPFISHNYYLHAVRKEQDK